MPTEPEALAEEVDKLLEEVSAGFVDDLRMILPEQVFSGPRQGESEESKLA